jgi:hypothetical protein
MKKFILIEGTCKDCTLFMNCRGESEEIKHFVKTNGAECKDGYIVSVHDDGKEWYKPTTDTEKVKRSRK